MAQLRLEPPEQFDFRKPDDWPRWKRRFGQYRVASGLESSSESQQVSTLLYCIGEEAESVLISTDATADDHKEYKKTIAKFDEFFSVQRNVIYERARFNRRSQLQSETAEEYIVELYCLAETCNYGDLKDEMIRDRLVVGIRDVSLSPQLQIDAGLTLEKAKSKIRQREAVGEQQKVLQGATKNATSLEEVGSQWRHKSDQPRRGFTNRNRTSGKERTRDFQSTKSCSRCGKEPHSRDKCPARDATCHRCTKKGHYGSQCRTKQMANVTTENFLGTAFLDTVAGKRSTAWHLTVKLNNQLTKFKLDTGAEVTAISRATYLCMKNTTYLIVVDYFSRFPEVKALSSTTSSSVINALKTMFARFGIPETLISDNGPQFSSLEFKEFSGVYEFNHVTSSPLYPQSNGQAVRSVQTVKHLLKDSSDPHMALLTYRSTPFPWCGLSPAQLLMGRCIRSNIPLPKEEMIPKWKYLQDFRVENQKINNKQERDYDRSHRVHELPPLPDNCDVWITSSGQPISGTITSSSDLPRSYYVQTPTGEVRRNQHHLNRVPDSMNQDQPQSSETRRIMTRSSTGTPIIPPDRLLYNL